MIKIPNRKTEATMQEVNEIILGKKKKKSLSFDKWKESVQREFDIRYHRV
jgi:hypothetical protein